MPRQSLRHALLNFDMDTYINPLLPGPLYKRLPTTIGHFLGHRRNPPSDLPPTLQTLHGLVASFTALLCVTSIAQFAPAIHRHTPPILLPSLGAGAVLNFLTLANPAAQPRPTIFGQALSAVVGVAIAKAFESRGVAYEHEWTWIAAPLAVALAGLVMRLTGTVHPPGGATAALAVASEEVRVLGWWLVAVITVATCVMVGVACVLNNLGRKWPEYWWTDVELPVSKKGGDEDGDGADEAKGNEETASASGESGGDVEKDGAPLKPVGSNGSERTLRAGACPCCGRG